MPESEFVKFIVTLAPAETVIVLRLKDIFCAVRAIVVGAGVEVVAGGVVVVPAGVELVAVELLLEEQAPAAVTSVSAINSSNPVLLSICFLFLSEFQSDVKLMLFNIAYGQLRPDKMYEPFHKRFVTN
jgi:hypothetical protein